MSALFADLWITYLQLGLFTAAGLLAIRNSPLHSRKARLLVSAALVGSMIMVLVGVNQGGDAGRGTASIWGAVLLFLIVVLLVRQILSQPTVTAQSIYGAISAYLIIGLMFSAVYSAIYFLHGRMFFVHGEPGDSSDFQYFSFTTLTTLGYGDFTAGTNGGRAVAMLEAMSGQIFLATLVAKLVASFRPSARAAQSATDPARAGQGQQE